MDYRLELEKMSNPEYVEIMLDLIKKEDLEKRKRKYSAIYCLYHIHLVFTELQKWSSLKYCLRDKKEYHYTTIQKTHLLWAKLDLYEKAHIELQKRYINVNFKYSKNLELYIDTTDIYNKKGEENVAYGMNPKKQISRISIICDIKKNILSATMVNIKDKTKENNIEPELKAPKKKRKSKKKKENNNIDNKEEFKMVAKKTMPCDNQSIVSSLDDLISRGVKYKTLFLVADGTYLTKEENKKILYDKYNVVLSCPHKKNQKIKTPEKDKARLCNRYVVENVNCNLKQFNRVCMRQDKLQKTYMSFVFMACCILFKK
jgi:hypothetical protein